MGVSNRRSLLPARALLSVAGGSRMTDAGREPNLVLGPSLYSENSRHAHAHARRPTCHRAFICVYFVRLLRVEVVAAVFMVITCVSKAFKATK